MLFPLRASILQVGRRSMIGGLVLLLFVLSVHSSFAHGTHGTGPLRPHVTGPQGPCGSSITVDYTPSGASASQHVLTYATRFVVPIPQLQAHPHASQVITDLVTNNPNILQDLTTVDYLVGLPFLLLVLSALLFWSIKTYRWFLHRRKKSRDMR